MANWFESAVGNAVKTVSNAAQKVVTPKTTPVFKKPVSNDLQAKLQTKDTPPSPFNIGSAIYNTAKTVVKEAPKKISETEKKLKRISELKQKQYLSKTEAQELSKLTGIKMPGEVSTTPSKPAVYPGSTLSAPKGESKKWEELQPDEKLKVFSNTSDRMSVGERVKTGFNIIGDVFQKHGEQTISKAEEGAQKLDKSGNKFQAAAARTIGGALAQPLALFGSGTKKLSGGEDLQSTKVVEGLTDLGFGAFGALNKSGAIFNAVMAQPAVQEVAAPAFSLLDKAKSTVRDLPGVKNLPEEAKDALGTAIDIAAFALLEKGTKMAFKKSVKTEVKNPTTGEVKTISVPTDRKWWGNFKKDLEKDLTLLKQNPIEFMKQKQLGLSIKDVSKDAPIPLAPTTKPKSKTELADDYVKEYETATEAARTAGVKKPTIGQKLDKADTWIRTKFSDAATPVLKMIEKNQKKYGYEILPEKRFDIAYDDALDYQNFANYHLENGELPKVLQSIGKKDDPKFAEYLKARHAKTLEGEGIKTGRDLAKDRVILETYEAKFEPLAKEVTNYANGLLDKSVEFGIVSKKVADGLKKKYGEYVPFNRIFSEIEKIDPTFNLTQSPASVGNPKSLKKIEGSTRAIENPVDSLIQKTYQVYSEGLRNQAANKLIGLKDLPGFEEVFIPLKGNNKFTQEQIKAQAQKNGMDTIHRMVDGKKETYMVDKDIAAFAKAYNAEQIGVLGKAALTAARVFKTGTTGLNIPFAAVNKIADVGTSVFNTKYGNRGVVNPAAMVKSMFTALGVDAKAAKEIKKLGLDSTSFDIVREPGSYKQNSESLRAQKNLVTKAKYTITKPSQIVKFIEDAISVTERDTRINNFQTTKKALIEEGYSPERAALLAKQEYRFGSANFKRQGELAKTMTMINPYMRAAIRGAESFRRAFKNQSPLRLGAKVAMGLVAPTAALTVYNLGSEARKEAYNAIRDSEKEGSWIIVDPWGRKDENGNYIYAKIKQPPGWSMFSNTTRDIVEQIEGGDKVEFGNLASRFFEGVTGFNPDTSKIASQIVPQPVKPFIENTTNTDLFTGVPIDKGMDNLLPEERYDKNTSSIAKIAGKQFGVSPFQVENVVKKTTGEVGMQLLNAGDQGLAATGVIKSEEVGGRNLWDSFSRRFTQGEGGGQGVDTQKVYEAKKKSDQEKATKNALLKREADKYIEAKDKEGLKAYAATLSEDQLDYFQDYLEKKAEQKTLGKQSYAVANLNGRQAIEYFKDDLDDIIQNKDKEGLKKIISQIKSEKAQMEIIEYLSKRKQQLSGV